MNRRREQYIRDVMSGSRRGAAAMMLRAALAGAEPLYAAALALRNRAYGARLLRSTHLPRPVISVGNITSGGTGKTPLVQWIAGRLRDAGRRVAVLSRGYKSEGGVADEMRMLEQFLNGPGRVPVVLRTNPSRAAAAETVLKEHPETDVFVLDDGFQHRAVARDLDLVLLSAADPFGYGHVLPRGLLREPLGGLRRADAFVLTHADQVPAAERERIEAELRRRHPAAPLYRAVHVHGGLRTASTSGADPPDRSLDDLRKRRFFAFGGIGNPHVLHGQLLALGEGYVGRHWLPDHHRYSPQDLATVRDEARAAGADLLITTEKDWVKVGPLRATVDGLEDIWRLDLSLQFLDEGEILLWRQVEEALKRSNGESN